MCDGIMARVFKNETVVELAQWATVPVINGLCDVEHPCQALADLLTLREEKGLEGRKIAYVGDGNNVCHSLMLLCAKIGVEFAAATPEGFQPNAKFVEWAKGDVEIFIDPKDAVRNADAVYTDVWTSMGQEDEAARRFRGVSALSNQRQVDESGKAGRDCFALPASASRRGNFGGNDGICAVARVRAGRKPFARSKSCLQWLLSGDLPLTGSQNQKAPILGEG
jgi:ornithine carbamoyltransferase